jgi:hypothetical protein
MQTFFRKMDMICYGPPRFVRYEGVATWQRSRFSNRSLRAAGNRLKQIESKTTSRAGGLDGAALNTVTIKICQIGTMDQNAKNDGNFFL